MLFYRRPLPLSSVLNADTDLSSTVVHLNNQFHVDAHAHEQRLGHIVDTLIAKVVCAAVLQPLLRRTMTNSRAL
jgi:hypothetical protein